MKLLVRLYNRLSYYFCYRKDSDKIEIKKETTVEELLKQLDEFYNRSIKSNGK